MTIEMVLGGFGLIGTVIAIYQFGVLRESRKRKGELQYILAGINSSANLKQQFWQNQITIMGRPETPEEIEVYKLHFRAKDGFAEIAQLATALEGVIDPDESAIAKMTDKGLEMIKKSNEMQEEFYKASKPDPDEKSQ
jgi:hypothetical protein